ncbi:MAG TPA: TetR/AcrR family transcriptional regulator [Actinophytocola sp.]|jgi:AcrR family transcriptional regulator|nr:TetR/AcrR family transcriptional regulator [Actinophytocola sp.]
MDNRVEKGRATRDALVGVARELFGERGYDGTSIGAVLEAAGVARGALYHHFANKEELFDAVLDREVERVSEVAAGAALAAADPLDSLRAACATWLRVVVLDPAVQRIVVLDPPSVVGWKRWRELDEAHTLGWLRTTIGMLAARGRIAEAEVETFAHMLLAAVAEAALLIAQAADPEAALASGQAAVDTLLTRVLGEPSR